MECGHPCVVSVDYLDAAVAENDRSDEIAIAKVENAIQPCAVKANAFLMHGRGFVATKREEAHEVRVDFRVGRHHLRAAWT
jgi:hypothetical protein